MANKVSTGKPKATGAIFRAPLADDLVLPTTASATLDADFVNLGYVSEDGVTNSNALNIIKVKEWGGSVVAVIDEGNEEAYKFKLIESEDANVLKAIYGDANVTVAAQTGNISVSKKKIETGAFAWVFDMVLMNNKIKRIVLPNASISGVGDIEYNGRGLIGYEVTLTCATDASGFTSYEYIE